MSKPHYRLHVRPDPRASWHRWLWCVERPDGSRTHWFIHCWNAVYRTTQAM